MARTRARTQSGARFWTSALIREMKMTHAAPPINITAASVLNLCNALIATITNPRLTTPVDTIRSVDHLSRADCMIKSTDDCAASKASEQQSVAGGALIHASRNRRQQREECAGEEHDHAGSKQYRQDCGRVADIANRGDGGSGKRLRRRASLANRPFPPGNHNNDTQRTIRNLRQRRWRHRQRI